MDTERALRFEVVTRMREAEEAAQHFPVSDRRHAWWSARARAFDEVYTEIKGMDIGRLKAPKKRRG